MTFLSYLGLVISRALSIAKTAVWRLLVVLFVTGVVVWMTFAGIVLPVWLASRLLF